MATAFYRNGVVTVTKGSKVVTGNHTTWTGGATKPLPGDVFVFNNKLYEVEVIVSDTELTLYREFEDDTQVDQEYVIMRNASLNISSRIAAAVAIAINQKQQQLDEFNNFLTNTTDPTVDFTDTLGNKVTVIPIPELEREIAEMIDNTANIAHLVQQAIDAKDGAVAAESNVTAMRDEVTQMKTEVTNMHDDVNTWQQEVSDNKDLAEQAAQATAEDKLATAQDVIDAGNSATAASESATAANTAKEASEAIQADVTSKHGDVEQWHTEVLAAKDSVDASETHVDEVKAEIDAIKLDMDSTASEVSDIKDDIDAKYLQINSWHTETGELKDDAEAAAAAAAESAKLAQAAIVPMRNEADMWEMINRNKAMYAASQFVNMGKHRDTGADTARPINEGMWSRVSTDFTNRLALGYPSLGSQVSGASDIDFPLTTVAGITSQLFGVNQANDGYGYVNILFPEAPNGTVIYDSSGDCRGSGKANLDLSVDADPKYGDVATDTNEAVARAFEGFVKNGDFRTSEGDLPLITAGAISQGVWFANAASHTTMAQIINGRMQVRGLIQYGNIRQYLTEAYQQIGSPSSVSVTASVTNNNNSVSAYLWYDGAYKSVGVIPAGGGSVNFVADVSDWSGSGSIEFRFYAGTANTDFDAVSVGIAPTSEEVVITPNDVFGGEYFLEEVSQANPYVYPKGMIQSQVQTMNGIATVRSNRPESYYSVFTGDEQLNVKPAFKDPGSLAIPRWVASADCTVRFKFRLDAYTGDAGIVSSSDASGRVNIYQSGSTHNWSLQGIGSSLLVNGEVEGNLAFKPVLGTEYEIEFAPSEGVSITHFMALGYSTSYETTGDIWDIELIDNIDPTNSRTYAVREIHNDGDLSTTTLKAGDGSALLTDSFDTGWSASNQGAITNGSLVVTNSLIASEQARINLARSIASDIPIHYSFDVVSATNDSTGVNAGRFIIYREGAGDGSIYFNEDDVGTTVTGTFNDTAEFNSANIIRVYSVGDSSFEIANIKFYQEVDGVLVNFPDDPWVVTSGIVGGGSAGKGVDFWAASVQEKNQMVCDHSNNIFLLADGRVVQWRMRQRTIRGAGNGSFDRDGQGINPSNPNGYGLTAGRGNGTPQGSNNTIPDYGNAFWCPPNGNTNWQPEHNDLGIYKASSGYGGLDFVHSVYGLCFFQVWGEAPRLNQAAYHVSLNPMGTRTFVQSGIGWNAKWFQVTGVVSITQCFKYLIDGDDLTNAGANLSNSGFIGSRDGTGRTDGRCFDAIQAGGQSGVIDSRVSAYDMGSPEEAAKIFQKVVTGIYRGKERLNYSLARDVNSVNGNVNYKYMYFSDPSLVSLFKSVYGLSANQFQGATTGSGFPSDSPAKFGGFIARDGVTVHPFIGIGLSSDGSQAVCVTTDLGYEEYRTDFTTSIQFVVSGLTKIEVSGEFSAMDVIGSAVNILSHEQFANGWLGGWAGLPSGSGGFNKLTREAISQFNDVMHILNSSGYTTYTRPLDTVTNRVVSVGVNDVGIKEYVAFAKQTKESVNKVVLNNVKGLGSVVQFARNDYSLLTDSLMGKVCTSAATKDLGQLELESYTFEHTNTSNNNNHKLSVHASYPVKHSPVDMAAPSNDSPALKALWHQAANNQQVTLNFLWNEMRYAATRTMTAITDQNNINVTTNGVYRFIDASGTMHGQVVRRQGGDLSGSVAGLVVLSDGSVMDASGNFASPQFWTSFPSNGWWGDDSTIRIIDGTGTFINLNGDTCLYGTSELAIPYGYTKNQARAGSQVPGVDL